jgi:hypothetical protein
MENTYWNSMGTHQNLAEQLRALLPAMGEIKGSKNKALEKFRKATNAYYDIFNNGGGNRAASIRGIFGFGMTSMSEPCRDAYGNTRRYNWNAIHERVEPIMDKIVLAAAAEQGI